MIVKIDRSFEKDILKLQDDALKDRLASIIIQLQKANKISEIINLKKLRGSKDYYRIKVGNYRLGLIINGKQIELIRFIHRKDVYKYFP